MNNNDVAEVLSSLIQCAVDMGIPLDHIPKNKMELGYLQCCLQWGIFILTAGFGFINSFVRSMMGSVR